MKRFSMSILSLLIFHIGMAQFNHDPAFKKFGFRAGANFCHFNFAKGSPPPATPIETSWEPGINLGFLMVVPITGQLFCQTEYLYSQMSGKIKGTKTAYHLDYFSLPVFLKYQLLEKFSLMAGPQFDLLIGAKKIDEGTSTNITHDTEERSISVTAGVEYQFTNSLGVAARYMHGLNHIGIGQRSDVQEFKLESFQLSAFVKF